MLRNSQSITQIPSQIPSKPYRKMAQCGIMLQRTTIGPTQVRCSHIREVASEAEEAVITITEAELEAEELTTRQITIEEDISHR